MKPLTFSQIADLMECSLTRHGYILTGLIDPNPKSTEIIFTVADKDGELVFSPFYYKDGMMYQKEDRSWFDHDLRDALLGRTSGVLAVDAIAAKF